MRESVKSVLIGLPLAILAGVAMGSTTVSAMQVRATDQDYAPAAAQQDRYTLGARWAARHHPENPDACPSIDLLFQSGCIAATRY